MKKILCNTLALAALAFALANCSGESTDHLDYESPNIGTLKYVPAGSFQRDATPENVSTIATPFRMSRYEITRAQFSSLMQADPVLMSSSTAFSSGTGDPVFMVSWYHAIAYCNKLSMREGLTPVYSVVKNGFPVEWADIHFGDVPLTQDSDWDAVTANWSNDGYRLPTAMEWMWAAMGAPAEGQGGGVDMTGYQQAYAGSTEGTNNTRLGDYAWYSANAHNKTHPIGSKQANDLGLCDMTGNVTELCWDWWSAAPVSGLLTDYRGASPGEYRVMKGGSWGDDSGEVAISASSNPEPEWRDIHIGFRVVRR